MDKPIHSPSPASTTSSTSRSTVSGPASTKTGASPTTSASLDAPPPTLSLSHLSQPTLLYLQRTVGNRAVARMLADHQPPSIQRSVLGDDVIQRSAITGHTSDGKKATPNAILAAKFGGDKQYRLSAVPRKLAKDPDADDTVLSRAQWKAGNAYKLKQVDRARQVKATIVGERRLTGGRKSKGVQSDIGNLGEQERAILGRSPTKSYEGGHLVSDKLLGEESYKEWNLAPQARSLNSPYYRMIEDMIVQGAVDNKTQRPNLKIPIDMVVDVDYKDDPYSVSVKELMDRNVMLEKFGKGRETETVTFHRTVPYQWKITAEIDPTYKATHSFATKDVTKTMQGNTVGDTKPFLKRQPSQEFQVQPGGLKSVPKGLVFGGGHQFGVTAEQHFPDPTNTTSTGSTTKGMPTAPPLRQSYFAAPFNLLEAGAKGPTKKMFLDTMGYMENDGDEDYGWSAAAYYIQSAVARNAGTSRQKIMEAACSEAGGQLGKVVRSAPKKVNPGLRRKMQAILYYDCNVKLDDQEVADEELLDLPEYLGPEHLKPTPKPTPVPTIVPMTTSTTPSLLNQTPLTQSIVSPTISTTSSPMITPSPIITPSPVLKPSSTFDLSSLPTIDFSSLPSSFPSSFDSSFDSTPTDTSTPLFTPKSKSLSKSTSSLKQSSKTPKSTPMKDVPKSLNSSTKPTQIKTMPLVSNPMPFFQTPFPTTFPPSFPTSIPTFPSFPNFTLTPTTPTFTGDVLDGSTDMDVQPTVPISTPRTPPTTDRGKKRDLDTMHGAQVNQDKNSKLKLEATQKDDGMF